MNNVIKSLVFAMAIGLFSCSEDESSSLSVVGAYTLTQENVSGCADVAENITENKTCTASDCETLTMAGNGTFSAIQVDNNVTISTEGTYTVNDNIIVFTYEVNGIIDTDVASYTLSGSTLVLTYEADSDGCVESDTYAKN